MATVRIPPVLRPMTGDNTTVEAPGSTLGEALEHLFGEYPDLRSRMVGDECELRRFVNVYVDDEDVRTRQGLQTPLGADSSVIVLPAMAGGAR